MPTATTRGAGYLVEPEARPFIGANRNENVPRSVDDPIPPGTTAHGGGSFPVEPGLEPFVPGQQSGGAPRTTDEPVPTVTADGAISLVQPSIIEYYGQSQAGSSVDEPLSTVMPNRKHGLVNPTLVEYYSHSHGADVDQPLPAVTTKARHGLANPVLVQVNHGNGPQGNDGNDHRAHPVDRPLGALTTVRSIGLAQPMLIQTSPTGGNGSHVRPTTKPYIVPNSGEREGRKPRVHDADEPAPAVTSRGAGSLVSPSLEPILKQVCEAGIDPRRLVFMDGQAYLLDIRFRMLQNAELARAMGFEDHETSYEFVGNVKEVTKQIGNAVPVRLAAALVKAALGSGAAASELPQ